MKSRHLHHHHHHLLHHHFLLTLISILFLCIPLAFVFVSSQNLDCWLQTRSWWSWLFCNCYLPQKQVNIYRPIIEKSKLSFLFKPSPQHFELIGHTNLDYGKLVKVFERKNNPVDCCDCFSFGNFLKYIIKLSLFGGTAFYTATYVLEALDKTFHPHPYNNNYYYTLFTTRPPSPHTVKLSSLTIKFTKPRKTQTHTAPRVTELSIPNVSTTEWIYLSDVIVHLSSNVIQ